MGGTWEANIYVNGKYKTTLRVTNNTTIREARNSLGLNNNQHFISRNNGFIEIENNFIVKNVWRNDEERGGYRIDVMTRVYFESHISGVVNIYFNMVREKAFRYEPYMTLGRIMELGGYKKNYSNILEITPLFNDEDSFSNNSKKDSKKYYLLSKNNIKIENYEGLSAKDIVKYEDNGKRIDVVDSNYYKRFAVIEHLRELESKIDFDWLEQTEFFKKLKNLCGEEATTGIIEELLKDRKDGKPKMNKEYIQRFLGLLIEENKSKNFDTSTSFEIKSRDSIY